MSFRLTNIWLFRDCHRKIYSKVGLHCDASSGFDYLSVQFFNSAGICPAEWNRPRKRLCVILVTENTEAHNDAREALRKIALESAFSSDRVRFAYIYQVISSI